MDQRERIPAIGAHENGLVRVSEFDFKEKPFDAEWFRRMMATTPGAWAIVKSADRNFCFSPLGRELPIDTLKRVGECPPVYEIMEID